jgi:hypothetical protein
VQPPPDTARLFPDDASLPDPAADRPYLFARLLEEGERADLRWLTALVPEAEIAAWFATSGGRALTHRSRSFWQLVLGVEPAPAPAVAAELWPLA